MTIRIVTINVDNKMIIADAILGRVDQWVWKRFTAMTLLTPPVRAKKRGNGRNLKRKKTIGNYIYIS